MSVVNGVRCSRAADLSHPRPFTQIAKSSRPLRLALDPRFLAHQRLLRCFKVITQNWVKSVEAAQVAPASTPWRQIA